MRTPTLVIITGPPASGKTTLAKRLSMQFGVFMLHRDGLKETLFDSLGFQDREWSRKLGGASYELLYYLLRSILDVKVDAIVESNFKHGLHSEKFRGLQKKYGFRVVQVVCRCDAETGLKRFRARVEKGERHPGHVDHVNFDEVKEMIERWDYTPLAVEGEVIEVDTSHFENVEYQKIEKALKKSLAPEKINV